MVWKVLRLVLLAAVVLVTIALLGGAWYYSDQIRGSGLEVDHSPSTYDLEVVALEQDQITLRVTPETDEDDAWSQDGLYGLEWEGGYDQVGAILDINDQQVVREFFHLQGDPAIGQPVRLSGYAFPGDPQQAHGIPFEEVTFSSGLGQFPAWLVDGSQTTWAIFVHGRTAKRGEALRMLPTVAELGLPSLVITYRNDEGVPQSPDGFYGFGQTEWQDLEGAVRYALAQGAEEVVLVGYSMGGGIVMGFLYESPLAERVRGVILDAPMLDFSATVDLGASQRRIPVLGLPIPGPLTEVAKVISGVRFGLDLGELDYLNRVDELNVPILLFHGDDDDTVPIETSNALAQAWPDLVTYIRVPGAGHVRSWNVDPEAYEAAVRDFLQALMR